MFIKFGRSKTKNNRGTFSGGGGEDTVVYIGSVTEALCIERVLIVHQRRAHLPQKRIGNVIGLRKTENIVTTKRFSTTFFYGRSTNSTTHINMYSSEHFKLSENQTNRRERRISVH